MTLRDPAKFPAWAFQILHHKCIDIIKHNQKGRGTSGKVFLEYIEGLSPSATASGEKRIMLDEAFAQLSTDQLSTDQRAAAILYFTEGLSLFEIATATSAPVDTVKSRIFHVRQHLKTALSGEQYD